MTIQICRRRPESNIITFFYNNRGVLLLVFLVLKFMRLVIHKNNRFYTNLNIFLQLRSRGVKKTKNDLIYGKTFKEMVRISKDNWALDYCSRGRGQGLCDGNV